LPTIRIIDCSAGRKGNSTWR